MSVRITYFVHGTTTDNEAGRATGWLPGELSEKGRQQAIELGRQVSDRTFDVVFCSDLTRAIESAQLGFGNKYPIVQDALLRECNYGIFNGHVESGLAKEDHIETQFPQGESYRDVEARLRNFAIMLQKEYEGKNIAIVAHQAPQLALEVILNGKTWQRAFTEDWRKTKSWQPGWEYTIN